LAYDNIVNLPKPNSLQEAMLGAVKESRDMLVTINTLATLLGPVMQTSSRVELAKTHIMTMYPGSKFAAEEESVRKKQSRRKHETPNQLMDRIFKDGPKVIQPGDGFTPATGKDRPINSIIRGRVIKV